MQNKLESSSAISANKVNYYYWSGEVY